MARLDPAALAAWCNGRWQHMPQESITGVGHDSRTIQPGQLYVALRGPQHDGHDFVAACFAQKAAAALVDAAYAQTAPDTQSLLAVADTRAALMQLAQGHRTTSQAVVVGITGSVGKTTVKELVADMLAQQGAVTRTRANWNNDIGLPLSLLDLLPDDRFGVFEIGMNHPGELQPLCDVLQPDHAILTPIGPAHLEHFDSVTAIAEEKATLLRALAAPGRAVLSVDDPYYPILRSACDADVIRVSLSATDVDYAGTWNPGADPFITVKEQATGATYRYPLPLPGRFMADNALRAVAMARSLGISADRLAEALRNYRAPAMRWREEWVGDILFINDAYNANPLSMRAAVDAFVGMEVAGRKWLVLAGMRELGGGERQAHLELGRYLARSAWGGVITSGAMGQWILEGLQEEVINAPYPVYACADSDAASARLQRDVQPGDAVLLKASRGEALERVVEAFKCSAAASSIGKD